MENRNWRKIGMGKVQYIDHEANYLWVKFDSGHIDKYFGVLDGDFSGLLEYSQKSLRSFNKYFSNLLKHKIRIPIFDPYK